MNGITFRIISYVLGDVLTIFYLYNYYRKIKINEKLSVVYDIKKNLEEKFLTEKKEKKKKKMMMVVTKMMLY